ncbi:cell adhesion molecule DSCAM-like [Liolophura sinensis]|uniref:cell adhesion molecule DSCAM-like n=1 Tax=Liolophura sinensis TaxID=3198878 RepID=UPI003158FAE8
METGLTLHLFALLMTTVYAAIEFTASPQNTAVVVGQDVRLDCLAQDEAVTGTLLYRWTFGGEPVRASASVFANHSLLVPRVQLSDLGLYTCNVSSDNFLTSEGRSATVIEAYTEEFVSSPSSIKASPGENVILTCITGRAAPNPSAFWEKDGRQFLAGDQQNASYGDIDPLRLGKQFSLRLQLVVENSLTGVYRCVLENTLAGVVKRSEPAFLSLTVPDTTPSLVISPPSLVFAPEGRPLSVDCVVEGNPVPRVRWLHNSVEVTNGERVSVLVNGTLQFSSVALGDGGLYLCQGTNSMGSISSGYMTLQVPRLGLEFVQQPQDIHAIAGQTARLLCTPPNSIPPATVTWYKGSSPVVIRSGEFAVSVIFTLSGGQDLFFSNVQQEDADDYICVAINDRSVPQSRTSRVARLSVTGGAIFTEPPTGQELIKGELLTLRCLVKGNPSPVIRWYKDGAPLQLSDRTTVARGGQELYISGVIKTDEGTYLCNVITDFNNVSASAYVTVLVPPAILSKIGHVIANLGVMSEVTLPCLVSGDPVPEVTWLHDGVEIQESDQLRVVNNNLHLLEVTVMDSGNYTCKAKNTAGLKMDTGEMEVIVPPSFVVPPSSRMVTLGQGLTLRCEVTGVPQPTIYWTYNDTNPIPTRHLVPNDLSVITIETVTWTDLGKYTCHANNSAGEASSSAYLTIQSAYFCAYLFICVLTPCVNWLVCHDAMLKNFSLNYQIKYSEVSHGTDFREFNSSEVNIQFSLPSVVRVRGENILPVLSDLYLTCETAGIPPPSVTWLFSSQEVVPSLDGRVSFPAVNSLLVRFAQENDSGTYSCVAKNEAGQDVMSEEVVFYGPPIPPRLESVIPVSMSSLNVSWSEVPQSPYADVTSYVLRYRESVSTDFVVYRDDIPSNSTYVELDGLKPASSYVVVMAAKNLAGEGTVSSALSATTFESAPSVPRYFEVISVGTYQVRLRWEIPKETRGQIRQYQVTFRQKTDQDFQTIVITSPSVPLQEFTLGSLRPHTTYMIQVRAATDLEREAVVWGNHTDFLEVTTLYAAPTGSPQNLTVISTNPRKMIVAWQPVPEEKVNGPITSYIVRYTSDSPSLINQSATVSVMSNDVVITESVFPWRLYTVTISAVNEAGEGPVSKPVTFLTSAEAPSTFPQGITARSDSGETILVAWRVKMCFSEIWWIFYVNVHTCILYMCFISEHRLLIHDLQERISPLKDCYAAIVHSSLVQPVPSEESNSPISGYLVEYGVSGESLRSIVNITDGAVLETTIRDLLPYTTYEIRVAAYTTEVTPGQSPYSPAQTVRTREQAAGSIRNLTYTVTPDTISLTWLPPGVTNGVLVKYVIRYQPLGNNQSTDPKVVSAIPSTISVTIANLQSDTDYQVNVTAENGAGEGETTSLVIKTALQVAASPDVTEPASPALGSPSPTRKEDSSKNLPAIVAGCLTGGLALLAIIGIIIYKCLKKRRHKNDERYYMSKVEEDLDSIGDLQIKSSTRDPTPCAPSPSPPPSRPHPCPVDAPPSGSQIQVQAVINNNNQSPTMPQSSRAKKLSGIDNAGFVDSTLGTREGSVRLSADQVYSQIDRSRKKQYRMRTESAAAIAVERNRGIQVLTGDKDSLINNEAEIVYDERTAL